MKSLKGMDIELEEQRELHDGISIVLDKAFSANTS
jgi:hypothetical protein